MNQPKRRPTPKRIVEVPQGSVWAALYVDPPPAPRAGKIRMAIASRAHRPRENFRLGTRACIFNGASEGRKNLCKASEDSDDHSPEVFRDWPSVALGRLAAKLTKQRIHRKSLRVPGQRFPNIIAISTAVKFMLPAVVVTPSIQTNLQLPARSNPGPMGYWRKPAICRWWNGF